MILLGVFLWALFTGHPWVALFLFLSWILNDREVVMTKNNQVKWIWETHELRGRTVTIADVVVWRRGKWIGYRGVSVRNPKDCPIASDGVKFALTRALVTAGVGKAQRARVWADFLQKFPPMMKGVK